MSDAISRPLAVVGHYNLLEQLEPAGPGDLFRARDTKLGRTVAVRLLPPNFDAFGSSRDFLSNVRGFIALSHPNVTALFDAGDHQGRAFIVFEYANGRSLRSEMGGRPVNVRRALDLAVQTADAVADAHACGYLHGGLSLDSIVVTAKGRAKVPAFALASREGFATPRGVQLHDCVSPEEAAGSPPDERSDVYSVGAVLYELLAARPPLHRGSAAPSASNSHVPPELDEVVLKAVNPNPNSRHQSAAILAADLRRVHAVLATRDLPGDSQDEPAAKVNVGRVVALALVIVVAAAAVVWWVLQR